ncbi:MAG: hypothetical protein ACREIC_32250 [Limisphaerales bacterium]
MVVELLLGWYSCALAVQGSSKEPSTESSVRHELAQAILSQGQQQQTLLTELADSGSKVASDVLNAWTRDGVYLYSAPDGAKIPVLLEEAQDAEGKSRALRVDTGQYLQGSDGKDLRFDQN